MQESPRAYIPMDRRQAIAKGIELPDRTTGAALFADISGFTPMTEALLREYGARRGAEELTNQLNLIYDALVTEVHQYGGSVLGFAGDAITCWFDLNDGLQATLCGLKMQERMAQFASIAMPSGETIPLAMKVAVAVGPVRRFQIGDPQIQYIDALAGATLDKMANAEHFAEKGEMVVTAEVVDQVGEALEISEWRSDEDSGERFAVVSQIKEAAQTPEEQAPAWPPISAQALSQTDTAAWILPPLRELLHKGQGQFLAELRPAVPLFLYFTGIDYDVDEEAGRKLDAFVCWVQDVLARYEAYPFQLTIGDKGSYLYTAFGTPVAHEDDAVRAVSAALQLQQLPPEFDFVEEIRLGISHGQLYTGAYGGSQRRTYGVLGDEVNLSARLMQAAGAGQTLVSQRVQEGAANQFAWVALPPFKVKGKTEPVVAFRPTGVKERQALHLQEAAYSLPMVGREAEMQLIRERLAEALAGHGQFIGITAEAGMGKSRLVAEVIQLTNERQLLGYAGECQSYGTNISYLVWQPIWYSFFGLESTWPLEEQVAVLERELNHIDPALVPRLPLLGTVLNLPIPDNDLTEAFDAKLRKTSLESLLVDCLRSRANETPLLLILEDSHWIDSVSIELLEVMSYAIVNLPIFVVMAYRPPELQHIRSLWASTLPNFTEISLEYFTPEEAEALIRLKLVQFSEEQDELPQKLVKSITERAQGNPFYIEELLNLLHDQGIDPHDHAALEKLELPTSLHSLILSRIDQLTETQKNVLKVASIIGRLFRAAWLWGMYPDLGDEPRVRKDLEALHSLDLVPQDKPDPELSYLFKHIVTQEVAYESLPFATRALLHNHLGKYIEDKYEEHINQYIDLLAYHYEHSENEPKKREYLRRAGEAAQDEYANEAAIAYYQKVLPLLADGEKIGVLRKLGDVLQLLGQWDQASEIFQQALTLAEALDDQTNYAWCEVAMGRILWRQSQYTESLEWLNQARTRFEALDDQAGVGQVLQDSGTLAAQQGDFDTARTRYEKSLVIRRDQDDKPNISSLLNNLAVLAEFQGDYDTARSLNEECLANRWEIGDKWAIAASLNNLGNVMLAQGDYETATTQLEIAVSLQREVGDRWYLANALNNLGNVTRTKGNYQEAKSLYGESLTIYRELGDKRALAYLLEDVGSLAALEGLAIRAFRLRGVASLLRETIGAPLPPAEKKKLDDLFDPLRQILDGAAVETAESEGRALSLGQAIDEALRFDE